MSRKHRNKGSACPNCGTLLKPEFEFCPHCGQENHDLRVPFRTFAYEFLESITHFDTKVWNTLKVIFTKPGQLTKDFVEGKRARYVHPARFYVFTSFVFFALLTIQLDRAAEEGHALTTSTTPDLGKRIAKLHQIISDSAERALRWEDLNMEDLEVNIPIDAPFYRPTARHLRSVSPVVLDSLLALGNNDNGDTLPGTRVALRNALTLLPEADSLNVSYRVYLNGILTSFSARKEEAIFRKGNMTDADVDSLLGDRRDSINWFERRALRSLGRLDLRSTAGKKQLGHAVVKAVSVVMFLLMPFTAVLLLWIFFRKRYYWEHLIFSVHTHTIYFLFFIVLLLLDLLLPIKIPDWVDGLMIVVCIVYLALALHRVYHRRWPATFARMVLMGIPYLIVFLVLLVSGVLWGFFSL